MAEEKVPRILQWDADTPLQIKIDDVSMVAEFMTAVKDAWGAARDNVLTILREASPTAPEPGTNSAFWVAKLIDLGGSLSTANKAKAAHNDKVDASEQRWNKYKKTAELAIEFQQTVAQAKGPDQLWQRNFTYVSLAELIAAQPGHATLLADAYKRFINKGASESNQLLMLILRVIANTEQVYVPKPAPPPQSAQPVAPPPQPMQAMVPQSVRIVPPPAPVRAVVPPQPAVSPSLALIIASNNVFGPTGQYPTIYAFVNNNSAKGRPPFERVAFIVQIIQWVLQYPPSYQRSPWATDHEQDAGLVDDFESFLRNNGLPSWLPFKTGMTPEQQQKFAYQLALFLNILLVNPFFRKQYSDNFTRPLIEFADQVDLDRYPDEQAPEPVPVLRAPAARDDGKERLRTAMNTFLSNDWIINNAPMIRDVFNNLAAYPDKQIQYVIWIFAILDEIKRNKDQFTDSDWDKQARTLHHSAFRKINEAFDQFLFAQHLPQKPDAFNQLRTFVEKDPEKTESRLEAEFEQQFAKLIRDGKFNGLPVAENQLLNDYRGQTEPAPNPDTIIRRLSRGASRMFRGAPEEEEPVSPPPLPQVAAPFEPVDLPEVVPDAPVRRNTLLAPQPGAQNGANGAAADSAGQPPRLGDLNPITIFKKKETVNVTLEQLNSEPEGNDLNICVQYRIQNAPKFPNWQNALWNSACVVGDTHYEDMFTNHSINHWPANLEDIGA